MWLIDSSIGRKLIMSITGLFLVLFLLFHGTMNFVVLFSRDAYNMICEFLGANWYALVGTKVLAIGFVVHILYALYLTFQNQRARGNIRYAVTKKQEGVSFASQNMLVLGIIVILGLALHLANFWYKMQFNEITGVLPGVDPHDGAALIKETFSSPVFVVLYLLWLGALWFHLTHGFWSSLQTMGWNNKVWFERWKLVSNIYSTIIVGGFALVVVVFFLKSLMCGAC